MCVLYGCEEKRGYSVYGINLLVFITEMESVYCAVRTGSLNRIQVYVGLLISLKVQRLSYFATESTSL
jgi:hypothetical protein